MLKLADSIMGNVMGDESSKQTGLKQPPVIDDVIDKSRAVFPLGFAHAASYVGHGVALIGDAAHRIHPLAGQGVNLGYGDITCLVAKISDAVYNGAQLNSLQYLLQYEQERLKQNVPIMMGVHGLQRLYNTDFPPVVLLRSLGLKVTQSLPFVKKMFVDRAMA